VSLIDDEVESHRAGGISGIRIKVNALVDDLVIDQLYRASQVGVPVRILVRGACALRPGVPGLSETIEVRSILGRFLEHSRVFWFARSGDPHVLIGSADVMQRNLDRRIEALVRVQDPRHVEQLGRLLDLAFDDRTSAWHLGVDGGWQRRTSDEGGAPLRDLQSTLIDEARARSRGGSPQRL
jgi:polyphosphate kinase